MGINERTDKVHELTHIIKNSKYNPEIINNHIKEIIVFMEATDRLELLTLFELSKGEFRNKFNSKNESYLVTFNSYKFGKLKYIIESKFETLSHYNLGYDKFIVNDSYFDAIGILNREDRIKTFFNLEIIDCIAKR